uniref:Sfi1 spindle body domain-containing protein n=1 Tax=Globisporangium ultimum (strain ATCC 200006 / CBS 805.95 / DAOM BR144) TaxID=431595 RepID=K3W7W4_GLOUD
MADDARVRAQLELLYRLGVIDREQPSQQATYEAEVAGCPAFTLSELTGGSEDGGEDTDDRVGSRVPMWKSTERRFRDDSRSPTSSRSRDTRYENSSREHSRKRQNLVNAAASPTLRLVNAYDKKKAKAREREDRARESESECDMEIPCEKALLGEVVVLRSMQSACEGANERTFGMEGAASSNQMARVDNKKPADPVATQEYAVLGSESAAKAPCLDPMDSLRCDQLSLQNFTTETIGTNEASDRLRKYFKALKLYKHNRESKQQTLLQHQRTLNAHIRRRALLQWSRVTSSQRFTRRVQQQILFRISRKRYFHVWRDCFQENRFIAEIKQRHASRSLQRHFVAWYFTAKTLQMGRKKAESARINMRELLFQEWRKETHFGIRCQYAAQECERLRKLNAIRKLQSWKIARRRQRHKEGAWRIRLLHHAWRNGFVKYHRHQQEKKTVLKKLDVETQRAYFDVWRGFLAGQIKTCQLVARASEFARIYCYKTYYTLWKIHRQRQKMKRQQLAHAGKYYTNRLLRKGVDVLEEIVNEASQNVQRSHHIRRRTRMFLRAKCFDEWKQWADTGKRRRCLSAAFQQRNRYLRSWFNPYRRAWNEWRSFTRERVQERQMDGLYLSSLQCKAFAAWRRRAQLMTMISKRQQALTFTACACVFSFWRSRVTHWQEVREVIDLARAVYRRKRCAATLREWSLYVRKLQKLRRQSDRLDEITKVKVSEKWFRVWKTLYHHRNTVFQHQLSRSTRWKRACFGRWRQYIALRVKLKRKLAYFQQVFGKYPTTALLRRDWVRWKQYTRTSRSIRLLRCRQRRKFLQTWWTHWKLFHVFCFAFREWRRVVAQTALESGHFGERLRLFYKAKKNRLLLSLLRQWVEFYRNKQTYRENVLSLKYEALREIIAWSVKARRAMKSYMKSWFSRWYEGVHSRNKAATHYWEARLQRKVLILWWRLMVHSKQELVLSEAKQVLGNMSFYHPKQQVYTNAINEKMIRHQHARDPSTSMAASQNARLKPMRRMLDPKEKKRYASAYRCEQLAGDSKRVTSFEVEGVSQENMEKSPDRESRPHTISLNKMNRRLSMSALIGIMKVSSEMP